MNEQMQEHMLFEREFNQILMKNSTVSNMKPVQDFIQNTK